jgi:peptidoglycan/xylan/chitin deacetylase (PgdA/CDA1 family)
MPSPRPNYRTAICRSVSLDNVFLRYTVLLLLITTLTSCGTLPTQVLGQNDRYIVAVAGRGDTPRSLAEEYLGDPGQGWRIEDANGAVRIKPGQYVIIPRVLYNSVGVFANGYQTVPVLSYHRFGAGKGRLSVSEKRFEEQMAYLKNNGYRVIPLERVLAFLRGEVAIPQRSVVLTIDDGYQSMYYTAYPLLKKYNFPATVFIYTDFIGNGGLTWREMEEMERSGLISFQAHSKTHDNLNVRLASESIAQYKARLIDEVRIPGMLLYKRLKDRPFCFAYPFGAVNQQLVNELKRNRYKIGVTVERGANPFFTYPYTLRRSMIYETDGIEEFKRTLRVFESRNL